MDEMITFSHNSVYDIDPGCSIIGDIDEGDQLSMEKTMYGMMLNSGNEAAYGIAEHVSGDLPSFAEMMNQRARELGCLDTHFVNANGLHNDDHYTTAYDLSLIHILNENKHNGQCIKQWKGTETKPEFSKGEHYEGFF